MPKIAAKYFQSYNLPMQTGTGILSAIDGFIPGGIENIFLIGLGIGAVIALGTLIFAGIKYSTSGDNASKQKDAKEWIWAAVKGLALIAGGAIIITIVNPDVLRVEDVAPVKLALIESPSLGAVLNPETGEVSGVGDSIILGDGEFTLTAVPGDMPREEYVSKLNEKIAEISEIESITDRSISDEEVKITVKLKEGSNTQEVINRLLSDFVSLSAVASNQSGASSEYHPYPGHYVKRGSRGEEVKWVQKALQITADGIFGPKTEAAVKNFQKIKGVQADGIVGPVTWKLLFGEEEDDAVPSDGNISKANLTVATWNIGRGSKVSGVTATKLAAKIKDNGIDIIGMQEAKKNGSSFVGQIAGKNNMSYYFTDTPAGNAVLSKANLTGKNYYTLVSCGERRALQKTVINVEGTNVSFYNVHISYQNECRKKQITDVYNKVKNDPNPVILVGDFNVATNCGLIKDIFGSGYSIVSKDTVNTGIACTDSIIISVKDISVKSSKTVKTKGSLSDHNMVIATLEIKK